MPMPLATRAFLLLNLLVFAAQSYLDAPLVRVFALWPPATAQYPAAPTFEVWQLLSYGFLHGGFGPDAGRYERRQQKASPTHGSLLNIVRIPATLPTWL